MVIVRGSPVLIPPAEAGEPFVVEGAVFLLPVKMGNFQQRDVEKFGRALPVRVRARLDGMGNMVRYGALFASRLPPNTLTFMQQLHQHSIRAIGHAHCPPLADPTVIRDGFI